MINNELSKLSGVLAYKTSYSTQSSLVSFDKSKVEVKTIEAAINKTGYKVKSYGVLNSFATCNSEKSCSDSSKSCCEKKQ
jgi:mercuric ion transport protein